MNQVVQPVNKDTRATVEIVVHITEGLNEDQRDHLASALKNTDGITGAEFCPLRYHLMLVRYDTDVFTSQDVLRTVAAQDVHAQLLGPV